MKRNKYVTRPEVINALRNAMTQLFELGYSFKEYDAGPEFGVVFESRKRNRKIKFDFSAIIAQPFYCRISRPFGILFFFNEYSTNRLVSFDLHKEFINDDKLTKLSRTSDTKQDLDSFQLYAEFFQTRLSNIISGEQWINRKSQKLPAA